MVLIIFINSLRGRYSRQRVFRSYSQSATVSRALTIPDRTHVPAGLQTNPVLVMQAAKLHLCFQTCNLFYTLLAAAYVVLFILCRFVLQLYQRFCHELLCFYHRITLTLFQELTISQAFRVERKLKYILRLKR